jgi:hypothetical protein
MKPIIFSTPMVQAILDGRKTQTRRIVKANIVDRFVLDDSGNILGSYTEGMHEAYPTIDDATYQEGDILWVRETWSKDENGEYVYRANYGTTEDDSFPPSMFKWRPSIHMPREAARIFLRVTNVRVERVQEITVDDCRLEGCCCSDCLQTGPHSPDCKCDTLFYNTWNDINAKRGYGWDTNPWVWVIEFERINKE